jgi:hypothetical protein
MPSTKPGLHRSREPQPAPATPEQRVAALRTVATHAHDAADCRALLTILGLDPHQPRCDETDADGERAPDETALQAPTRQPTATSHDRTAAHPPDTKVPTFLAPCRPQSDRSF